MRSLLAGALLIAAVFWFAIGVWLTTLFVIGQMEVDIFALREVVIVTTLGLVTAAGPIGAAANAYENM